jgi:hypothetical protein
MSASPDPPGPAKPPLVAAVEMGYGHLRAAHALADALSCPVLEADRSPLVGPDEHRLWGRLRTGYEIISRSSQVPLAGRPLRAVLDGLTDIPHLYPYRDQSRPTPAVRLLARLARHGLGAALVAALREEDRTLLTTFFAPAIVAADGGVRRVVCVVTDSDINRVWAPERPTETMIHYCVPSERALRRLRAYGVPSEHIHFTGFPLPGGLVGGPDLATLRRNLAARIVRLDPAGIFRQQYGAELTHFLGELPRGEAGRPPLLVFAVGGAGAQHRIARPILASVAGAVRNGRLRLALVAGVRGAIASRFRRWLAEVGLHADGETVRVLHEGTLPDYFRAFDRLMADADVLWTKPSELTFFAALGIPLVFSWPVGVHERLNRRWAIQRGAGVKQDTPRYAWQWLDELLQDGTLAGAAWSGAMRLPKLGTYRVLDVVRSVSTDVQ